MLGDMEKVLEGPLKMHKIQQFLHHCLSPSLAFGFVLF